VPLTPNLRLTGRCNEWLTYNSLKKLFILTMELMTKYAQISAVSDANSVEIRLGHGVNVSKLPKSLPLQLACVHVEIKLIPQAKLFRCGPYSAANWLDFDPVLSRVLLSHQTWNWASVLAAVQAASLS
jgi:hypothetical protein